MDERKIVDRRFFNGAIACSFVGLGMNLLLGSEIAAGEEETKILTNPGVYNYYHDEERRYIAAIAALPEARVPKWEDWYRADYFTAHKLGMEQVPVTLGERVDIAIDEYTFKTPNFGLATPQELLEEQILIYGHSSLNNVAQGFAKITKFDLGDLVFVQVFFEPGNELLLNFGFVVSGFRLVSDAKLERPESLTLSLQTSAAIGGHWFIDKNEVLNKADVSLFTGAGYSVFFVDAKPVRIKVAA